NKAMKIGIRVTSRRRRGIATGRRLRFPQDQLREVAEKLQRPRIRERLDVLHRPSVNHLADRNLADLAAHRTRYVVDLNHYLRHVQRRSVAPYLRLDPRHEIVGQAHALPQPHEQHDPHIPVRTVPDLLPHRNALDHFWKLFDLAIYLSRSYPYSARIQSRVAASVDDHPVMFGELGPVTMTPYVLVEVEVRRAIPGAVCIIPESHGHARER